MIAAMAIMLPGVAAASVTFDLTLTDASAPAYSGTGLLTLDSAPAISGVTNYTAAQVSGLTFTIAGQTFTAPPGTLSAVQFIDGTMTDITFSQQIGSSPDRYELDTTSGYAFYYNNESSAAYGTITAAPANMSAAPEPSTWAMMIVGFGLTGALMRRRTASQQGETSIASLG